MILVKKDKFKIINVFVFKDIMKKVEIVLNVMIDAKIAKMDLVVYLVWIILQVITEKMSLVIFVLVMITIMIMEIYYVKIVILVVIPVLEVLIINA